MSTMTLSMALEMQKALKERRKQLDELAKHPLYDVVKVDEKITNINNALFEITATIKQVNAITEIDLSVDFKLLMSPLAKV